MPYISRTSGKVIRNKSFLLLLASQGISNLGDAFQLLAVTTLLINMTGSGLIAGFAMICTPLPSLFLSPFAGVLGDRFSSKRILMMIDILRGIVVLLFTINRSIIATYILIFLISSFDILYSPARNKVITSIIDSKYLVTAGSLQSGVNGTAFILGPVIAGIIVGAWGVNTAFLINSFSFFISALLIMPVKFNKERTLIHNGIKLNRIFVDIKESLRYTFIQPRINELVKIGFINGLGMASINITFYSFAFDTLGISSKGWSILLSALYGTNVIAMVLSVIFIEKTGKHALRSIYILMLVVSGVWCLYSISQDLHAIILLQLVEGTSLSLISILMGSYLLMQTPKNFTARVTAGNDLLNNTGKLVGIIFTYVFLQAFKDRSLFIINSFIWAVFSIYKLVLNDPDSRRSHLSPPYNKIL